MRTIVTEISAEMTASEAVVLTAVTNLNDGKINETIASFAEEFTFKDHGIGLDFNDKVRLAEFFQKTRELYPDSFVQVDTTFSSGDCVFVEWTLRATLTEPFFGGLSRRVPITVQGVSIVRMDSRRISDWVDYYDGLTSRRTRLADYFTEWIEY
jgi:steroid delta-isomerase-like uncharacterized protein